MATHFKQPSARTAGATSKYRSPRINFAPIKEMFKPVRATEPSDPSDERWVTFAREADQSTEEHILGRFPIVRHGYDCPAVDEFIADLERDLSEADRELAELRGRAPASDEVTNELKRIGEQTSAVLIAAHEQRDEILRAAKEEAERCVAQARAQAATLSADSQAELRELEARKAETRRERDRIFEEIRTFSTALNALIEPPQKSSAPPS
jgi:DivIVA protein